MAKRSLNVGLLIGSAVVATGLGWGLHRLHRWQLVRLSDSLLVRAAAYEGQSQWRQAASQLDDYLRLHDGDAAVGVRLATATARYAQSVDEKSRAIALHYQALAAQPTADDAARLRTRLAELLLETGRLPEAEQEARAVLAQEPHDPAASRSLALALIAQLQSGTITPQDTQNLRLLETAQAARRLNPADQQLALATASLLRDQPDALAAERPELTEGARQELADQCVDELVEVAAGEAAAHLARFEYRRRYGLPGANDDLQAAQSISPRDESVLFAVAATALDAARALEAAASDAPEVADKFAAARRAFEDFLASGSARRRLDAYLGLGTAYVGEGQLDSALAIWRKGIAEIASPPAKIALLDQMADVLLQRHRAEDAAESLAALDTLLDTWQAAAPRDQWLPWLQKQGLHRAQWHLLRSEAAAALHVLDEVIARQDDGAPSAPLLARAWQLTGQAQQVSNQWAEAAVALDRAARFAPQSADLRLRAGRCWLASGRAELAAERAQQSLAIAHSGESHWLRAAAQFELQLRVESRKRSWTEFEQSLQALEFDVERGRLDSPWRAAFLKADYLLSRDLDGAAAAQARVEAKAVIDAAAVAHGEAVDFWRSACLMYARLGERASASCAVSRFCELHEARAEQAVVQSRVAKLEGDLSAARQVLEKAIDAVSALEKAPLRAELIEVAERQGDLADVQRLLEQQHAIEPRNLPVAQRLCETALARRDFTALARTRASLELLGTTGQCWARYYHALELGTLAENPHDARLLTALDEQTKLAIARPYWPQVHTLRGLIEEKLSHLPQAVAAYEEAIRLGERRLFVFARVASLLEQTGRSDQAEPYRTQIMTQLANLRQSSGALVANRDEQIEQFLKHAIEDNQHDSRLLHTLGNWRAMQGKLPEAAALYRQVLQHDPRNVTVLNNLAAILAETPDQRSEALALIDEAIEIAGEQPALCDTKGTILFQEGQAEEALPLLETAVRGGSSDPRYRFHLAAACDRAGHRDRARAELERSLASKLEQQVLMPSDQALLRSLKAELLGTAVGPASGELNFGGSSTP